MIQRLIFICLMMCPVVAVQAVDLGSNAPLTLGQQMPHFSKTDFSTSKRMATRAWLDSGYGVVVNFGATFCVPCRVELPWLWSQVQQNPKLRMVWVLAEPAWTPKAQKFLAELGYTGPVVLDDNNLLRRRFGAGDVLPYTVYVAPNGRVQQVHPGFEVGDTLKLKTVLQDLTKD
jgi:thiol-disulfide isomerase/thioredoxin